MGELKTPTKWFQIQAIETENIIKQNLMNVNFKVI
jgi:hypothetical protein